MATDVKDQEIILAAGDMRARVSPYGASLRGVWRETAGGRQIIATAYSGADNKAGGQGDIMIPFPGRVAQGKYTFEGVDYQMERNDKESPAAIHGFLRFVPWQIAEQSESAVTFMVSMGEGDFKGYPFAMRATISYAVSTSGLTCNLTVENTGTRTAPVAAGFHPYFTVGSEHIDGDTLHVPMSATLDYKDLLPTGRVNPVEGTAFDFRTPRTIGGTVINTCFVNPTRDPDGLLRLTLESADKKRKVTVWMDAAFDYVVLYSGDPMPDSFRRRSLAIEPMTCGSDALNHPEWGLIALAPGASVSGAWGVEG